MNGIIATRKKPKIEPVVDGYTGFLILNRNDMPFSAQDWERYFHRAVAKYNSVNIEQLPRITPHICRHTYCSNMEKAGMNPKVLQYLMGHANIVMTLDVYTHLGIDDAKKEIERASKLS